MVAFWRGAPGGFAAADYSLQVLHRFVPPGPLHPASGVLRTPDGNLYGTAPEGTALEGGNGHGVVYRITPEGQLLVLAVADGVNGYYPTAGLAAGEDGRFYGSFLDLNVFSVAPAGSLANVFSFGLTNGYQPGPLLPGGNGDFYGSTRYGGAGYNETNNALNGGTAFRLTTNGIHTLIVSFTGANGLQPNGRLLRAGDGYIYGTTAAGGEHDAGTVFRISPSDTFDTLTSLDGTNLIHPGTGLVEAGDGWLYGMTTGGDAQDAHGSIFKVSTAGDVSLVARFNGANGRHPTGSLVRGDNGCLVGVTRLGGAYDGGTAFVLLTNAAIRVLCSFGPDTGQWPTEIIPSGDGNLYGTTSVLGSAFAAGTVFRLARTPVMSAAATANGILHLAWTSFAGGVYQVESSSEPAGAAWFPCSGRITANAGSASWEGDTASAPARYYRVSLLPW